MTIHPAHSDRASAGKTNPAAALPAQKSGTPGTASPLLRADDFVPATPGEPAFPRVIVVAAAPTRLDALDESCEPEIELLWRTSLPGGMSKGLILSPDEKTLYVANVGGYLCALDANTGRQKWQYENKKIPSGPFSLDLSTDGSRLFTYFYPHWVVVDSSTGKRIVVGNIPQRTLDKHNSELYTESHSPTGDITFQSRPKGGISDYTPSCVIARADTLTLWKFSTEGNMISPPAISQDGKTLFVSSISLIGFDDDYHVIRDLDDVQNCVYALDAQNGHLLWKSEIRGGSNFSPSISQDGKRIFVGSLDRFVYVLDALDGHQIGKFKANSSRSSTPTISRDGNRFFVGSEDGNIYALRMMAKSARDEQGYIITTETPEGIIDIGGVQLPGPSY